MSAAGQRVTKFVEGSGAPGAYEWRPRDYKRDRGSGSSDLGPFSEARINLTYVAEVRGKFVISCYEIKNIGKEVLAGLIALSKHARKAQPFDWDDSSAVWPPPYEPRLGSIGSDTVLAMGIFSGLRLCYLSSHVYCWSPFF